MGGVWDYLDDRLSDLNAIDGRRICSNRCAIDTDFRDCRFWTVGFFDVSGIPAKPFQVAYRWEIRCGARWGQAVI